MRALPGVRHWATRHLPVAPCELPEYYLEAPAKESRRQGPSLCEPSRSFLLPRGDAKRDSLALRRVNAGCIALTQPPGQVLVPSWRGIRRRPSYFPKFTVLPTPFE